MDRGETSAGRQLLDAASSGDTARVQELLATKNVQLESKGLDDRTPLMEAAVNGHEAITRLVLEAGADKDAKDFEGDTPLMSAATEGHEAITRLLLEAGADVYAEDQFDLTALDYAERRSHKGVAALLEAANATSVAGRMAATTCTLRPAACGQHGHASTANSSSESDEA